MDIQAYIQSGIIESYVLGLANAEEVSELEKNRLRFPEVRQALSDFSASLEQIALDNAIAPPIFVKAKVMAAIKAEKPATVVSLPSDIGAAPERSSTTFRTLRFVAAASVILLIVSAALNLYLYSRYKKRNEDYQALQAQATSLLAKNQLYQTHLSQWKSAAEMVTDPAMAMIKMNGTPGREQHLATIFWNTKNKDVYLMPDKLPVPGKGKQYQLWALVNGKPVDAGVLDPQCEGVCKMKNIQVAQAFAVTLENMGGSSTPNMKEMYVLGKV